jgi:hypothetical protein
LLYPDDPSCKPLLVIFRSSSSADAVTPKVPIAVMF